MLLWWDIGPVASVGKGVIPGVYERCSSAASEARTAPELPGAEPSGGGKAGRSDAIGVGM